MGSYVLIYILSIRSIRFAQWVFDLHPGSCLSGQERLISALEETCQTKGVVFTIY
jgi:hypothetical protein